ncbi:MAG: kelch repeat-containing protein, partial [Bacteroidota bacterium]
MYGGARAKDNVGGYDLLDDLWRYTPGTGLWTWESGTSTGNQTPVYGLKGVAAQENHPGARLSSMSWIGSSGDLWIFGGGVFGSGESNDLWKYNVQTGLWTWLTGGSGASAGNYGIKGTGSPSAVPGARSLGAAWSDAAGDLWLFGGNGYDADGAFGQLNDLWRFSVSTGNWIWVGGSDKVNAQPVYGTLGVASVVNDPGARHAAISWTDNRGKFWMFGGQGYYSDLWQFDPAEGVWTWMGGSAVPNEPGVYGTLGASSTANRPGARAYGQGWTDALGNLWLFGGDGVDGYGNSGPLNDLWKFDPVRKDWTWMGGSDEKNKSGIYGVPGQQSAGNIPGSRRGSAGWRAANGDLWLFGGTSIGPDGFAERDD